MKHELKHELNIAKAISDAAGPEFHTEFQEYLDKYGELTRGCIMVTSAGGSLECGKVIHVVGPEFQHKNGTTLEEQQLRDCIFLILSYMIKEKINSVSIPSIPHGNYRFPEERCAKVMGRRIRTFIKW